MAHRYANSPREIQPGDAAYLMEDLGDRDIGYAPVLILRVNRVSITARTERGRTRRFPHDSDRHNNASFAPADFDDDAAFARIKATLP